MENMKENSEKIWKIQKKIVEIFGKYGRKISWIVIRYGKYWRKYWKDMKNTEETKVDLWKDSENMEGNCEMIWKIQHKTVKWYGKYGRK